MADQYGLFWNSINFDRTYDADSFAEWLRKFFTTGIFNGEMQVTPSSGMTVSVAPGYANLEGKVRFFDATQSFTLDPASGTYPRIDTIVVRSDSTQRKITTEYVKGAYSGSSPVPTAPVRSAGIYEIVLAQILIGAGITAIMTQDITDTRPDDDLCGWVTSTVESVPMDQITSQMQADFLAWYDHMKGQLSEDAAGNLQLQIDANTEDITSLDSRMTTAEGNIATNAGHISNVASIANQTSIQSNQNAQDIANNLKPRMTTAQENIYKLQKTSDSLFFGFAFVQTNPMTASYKRGDVFLFIENSASNYDLVMATQDIPAGATVQYGVNIESFTLGGAINALNNGLSILTSKIGGILDLKITLGGDVLTVAKSLATGITFYSNSNQPTNRPSGCDWGSYTFFKVSNGNGMILYADSHHIATAIFSESVTPSTFLWHVV